jgi:hypothetical protein
MTSAPAPPPAPARSAGGWWRLPVVVGVCFGLGYGVVQRLMAVEFPRMVQLGQSFDVREFPGTALEALRLRAGTEAESIRGDLGVLELDKQQAKPPEPELEPPLERELEPAPPTESLPPPEASPPPLEEQFQPEPARVEAPPELAVPATP